jgi:hypothetical protein
MVDSVDFDFHHSFLITLALFAASILAIFYLSCLFALAQLVYRECVAPNGGEVCYWRWQNQNRVCGLEEEGSWFANATVGCKWGMAAQWLFISLTALFHLPETFGIRVHETWHDPPGFHFFPGYCASKCAPRFLYGKAHTGMLCLVDISL